MNEEKWDYICSQLEILEDKKKKKVLKDFLKDMLQEQQDKLVLELIGIARYDNLFYSPSEILGLHSDKYVQIVRYLDKLRNKKDE
jgi:hypothetical protein